MINIVTLLGRVGCEPTKAATPSGMEVSKFSIATNKIRYDKNNQRQEKTTWHRIVVYGKNAENCNKYIKKGMMIYIGGELNSYNYDDRNGNKVYVTEVTANEVRFLPRDNKGQAVQDNNQVDSQQTFATDEIPF